MRRIALVGLGVVCAAISAGTGTASASVTIGQTGASGGTSCVAQVDALQPTVTSGNAYIVPSDGGVTAWTLTSWSHLAKPTTSGQMLTMKVFRRVASPDTYQVVGHDGPRPLSAGALNTFQTQLAVKAGDILGLNSANAGTVNNGCVFPAPGDFGVRFLVGDLGDGAAGDFGPAGIADRANISAEIAPTNTFTIGAITRNKKKGTATELITVPNPGTATLTGSGVKQASSARAKTAVAFPAAGTATLPIRVTGKKKRKLNATGKVKITVKITYTPAGGNPSSQTQIIKLKKKLKKS